jgi:two-component system, NarL family, nitrate/nitrite response regulator NarL
LPVPGYISQMEAANAPQARPVTVLIADDEPLFVESVAGLLEHDERIRVIGTATNGQDAVDLARALDPDVTLMDISMPVLDGIEAARRIRLELPDACILILTGSSTAADIDRARLAGVSGFLTKDRISTQLVGAILQIANR